MLELWRRRPHHARPASAGAGVLFPPQPAGFVVGWASPAVARGPVWALVSSAHSIQEGTMPDNQQSKGRTTVTSPAQGRFTMQLPVEVGKELDAIGARMTQSVFEAAGIRVELSRPDVVKSLVATAKAVQAEQDAERAQAGAEA